jgi:hypothetical protein
MPKCDYKNESTPKDMVRFAGEYHELSHGVNGLFTKQNKNGYRDTQTGHWKKGKVNGKIQAGILYKVTYDFEHFEENGNFKKDKQIIEEF